MKFINLTSQETETFPFVDSFDDYHEIDDEKRRMKAKYQYDGNVIMGKEIAFDGFYWALFWIKGMKPERDEVTKMLKEDGFQSELDHTEVY